MSGALPRTLILLVSMLAGPAVLSAIGSTTDQDLLNQGKLLIFEQKWESARQAFQRLIRDYPQSALLPQAHFQVAYCLRLENKPEEAVAAYDLFLSKYPKEPFFAGEAGRAAVELAASLFAQGKTSYRGRLVKALQDKDKDVRYFAAIRCSSIEDLRLEAMCLPILKEIVAHEKQTELVNYASIALLRIDPGALSRAEPQKKPAGDAAARTSTAKMFHLRIYRGGENTKPKVELDIPVSFAQLAVRALDESTKAEIRKKGFDIDDIWNSLNKWGPSNILTIRDGDALLKIWIQ